MAVLQIFTGQPLKDRIKPQNPILIVSRIVLDTTAISGKRNSELEYLGRKYLLHVSEGAFENFTLHLFLYFIAKHVPCIVGISQECHLG